jgi:hypothetical protein
MSENDIRPFVEVLHIANMGEYRYENMIVGVNPKQLRDTQSNI